MDYGLLKKYTRELKVLFIEDNIAFRNEFSELLNDIFSMSIDIAEDGEIALECYKNYFQKQNSYYDIVITDIKMPKLDGVQLTEAIYKINQEQKMVVLSARNEFDYLLKLMNLGIEHFFPKPIDYDRFLNELFSICKKIYHEKREKNFKEYIAIDDDIFWNLEKKELIKEKKLIKLTKMEIILLSKMTENNARLFTTEELYITFWESPYAKKATMDNLKNIISRLRKKVPEIKINNLYGMGYKLQIK